MNRREWALGAGAAVAAYYTSGAFSGEPAAAPLAGTQSPTKWPPYANTVAIDAAGSFGRFVPEREDATLNAADLADARESGLSASVITLAPNGSPRYGPVALEAVEAQMASWDRELAAHPDTFMQIARGADLALAHRSHKVGLIYGFQDSAPLGEDLDSVERFYKRGVRVIQLTHNQRNLVGDGCMEPGNAGLSEFGHAVIDKLNEQRILVDVAHGSRRTVSEGIAASQAPVVISHTGCAALADVPRCVTDDALRAMANRGGVAGIVFWPYLTRKDTPTAADVIRHIEYAINVCGEDHVGIGTDVSASPVDRTPQFEKSNRELIKRLVAERIFDRGRPEDLYLFVTDLNHARRFETLGSLLSRRGHSDARIAKILGGNFARVMTEVWG
ncbi:MAG: membrane dipeptidase [Proteobacteria bacterium]|nr:membrane dipeptidase [Pseudomonadota bacterium]